MSFLYCHAKEMFMGRDAATNGNITLSTSIYAALIKTSYTPDVAAQMASTTASYVLVFAQRVSSATEHATWVSNTNDALLTANEVSSSNGITFFDAADCVFNSVSAGQVIHGICIYKKGGTGNDDTTSIPIAFINIGTTTSNGASINVNWDNGVNRIFALT